MQGVFSLCRRNQVIGIAAMALGAGLLLCFCFESDFMRCCAGVVLIGSGFVMLQKK
jgi:hypothetical protein